jgi:hypothetical protein
MNKQGFFPFIFLLTILIAFLTIGGCADDSNPVSKSAAIPAPPVLISPQSGDTVKATSIVFRWNPSPGALKYTLYVATDTGFSNIRLNWSRSDNTADTISSRYFNFGTKYYWRVNASNSSGTSGYSAVRNFIHAGTDDELYLRSVIINGFNSDPDAEDNLMYREQFDMNDGAAFADYGSGFSPMDSVVRWGRIITGTNYNLNSCYFPNDSEYSAEVGKSINGYYRIIGYHNGGQIDSVDKPFTMSTYRRASFRRIARTPDPAVNWRMRWISLSDGATEYPQSGYNNSRIREIFVSINGTYSYDWWNSFTYQNFDTKYFGGEEIPLFHRGDNITVTVYVDSPEPRSTVAWHWAKNTFGYHRIPFAFVSSYPGGEGYINEYRQTFTVYSQHQSGCFNGFIIACTPGSLNDDNPVRLSVSDVGVPYRVER